MSKMIDIVKIARKFKLQPIVCAKTLKMNSAELLSRSITNFKDEMMIDIDIQAVKSASNLLSTGIVKNIHFNAEIKSILNPDWIQEAVYHAKAGMVLEVVERNSLLDKKECIDDLCSVLNLLKCFGLMVAMDDVSISYRDVGIIERIKPDIVKLDSPAYINKIKQITTSKIVLERIEDKDEAKQALFFGVDYFQGYYYDLLFEDSIPKCFTPPGVLSREIKESLVVFY